MATMNVSLPKELVTFVEREVASGEYNTASEVVREGLRILLREKVLREDKAVILRREIEKGIEDARAGHYSKRSIAEISTAARGMKRRR
jgi:antitoxin ParD1/3/4